MTWHGIILTMTDVEFTRALERGQIANKDFRHSAHLHVAWTYLSESVTTNEAARKMGDTLRKFATAAGVPEKYHETITLFWIFVLADAHVRARTTGERLEQIVHANPRLLEKDFPLEYYSPERLFSQSARKSWVEPDLKPLSTNAAEACSSCSQSHAPNRTLHR
jgi:hypothetical protein